MGLFLSCFHHIQLSILLYILNLNFYLFQENYLLLEVPEIRGPYQGGGNTVIRNSFAKLNLQNSVVLGGELAFNQLLQPFTNLLISPSMIIFLFS